jgi:hypothetical protein
VVEDCTEGEGDDDESEENVGRWHGHDIGSWGDVEVEMFGGECFSVWR